MRLYRFYFALLLVSQCCFAAVDQHYVKAVAGKPLRVYLIADQENILCTGQLECEQKVGAQFWQQACSSGCDQGLSWQDYLLLALNTMQQELAFDSFTKIPAIDTLAEHIEDLACQQSVLFWHTTLADYALKKRLLRQLAENNVQTILLIDDVNDTLPIEEQQIYARLGFTPLLLNGMIQPNQLLKQIKHVLQRAQHASGFNLAGMQLTGLSYGKEDVLVQLSKPMANQRWLAELYHLPPPATAGINPLFIQANGQINWDFDELSAFNLGQIGSTESVPSNHSDIEPSIFAQQLSHYLELEDRQQLLHTINRYLQGESLFKQSLSFSLLDSPRHAFLFVEGLGKNSWLYLSSDGVLHFWPNETLSAQKKSLFSKQAVNLMLRDIWDLGTRSDRYNGQITAARNKQFNQLSIFYGSGEAESALYHWQVDGDNNASLRWRVSANTVFTELGELSQKVRALAVNYDGIERLAVLTGAGYDPLYSASHERPQQASKGNAVYLIDAATGGLLWKVSYDLSENITDQGVAKPAIKHAFAASPTLNKQRNTALLADMGGQIWQLFLPMCAGEQCLNLQFKQQHWQLRHLANTLDTQTGFYYPAVFWQNKGQEYIAAITGSAKQAHLSDSTLFFFASSNNEVNLDQLNRLEQCENAACAQGWKYQLAESERPHSELLIQDNSLYLLTYQEQIQSCTFVPDSYRLYRFKLSASVVEVDSMELADNSIFQLLNQRNADFLLPLIDRYFDGERDAVSVKKALENVRENALNNGIVISSWREYYF